MGLVIIADDLTGALDSAAPFCRDLGELEIEFHTSRVPSSNTVYVVPTRDQTPDAAMAMMSAAFSQFAGADLAFKKIDSLLRGHWAGELAQIMHTGLFERVILAPAFPQLGRITRNGVLFLRTSAEDCSVSGHDVAAKLQGLGLSFATVPPGGALKGMATEVLLCDAENEAHLERIVVEGRALEGRTLWCGSGGLANALAGGPAHTIKKFSKVGLAIVGSHHCVMRRQIEDFNDGHPERQVIVNEDIELASNEIARRIATAGSALVTFIVPDGTGAREAATLIESRIRLLVPHLQQPGFLFASGGETLMSICKATSADGLSVFGQLLPGMPVSRIKSGLWAGTTIVSKSGAFGDQSTLTDLLR